jgi:precorrin-6B methylase 1
MMSINLMEACLLFPNSLNISRLPPSLRLHLYRRHHRMIMKIDIDSMTMTNAMNLLSDAPRERELLVYERLSSTQKREWQITESECVMKVNGPH